MFERFTDRARRVIVIAQEEAIAGRAGEIRPDHLLVGLLREGAGVGCQALTTLGITTVSDVANLTGDVDASGYVPFTPATKKAIELSLREALKLGHNYVGTEHILLGLVAEGGVESVFTALAVDLEAVRSAVIHLLTGASPATPKDTTTATLSELIEVGIEAFRRAEETARDLAAAEKRHDDAEDAWMAASQAVNRHIYEVIKQAAGHGDETLLNVPTRP